MEEDAAAAGSEPGRWSRLGRRLPAVRRFDRHDWPLLVAALAVIVPTVRMLRLVLGSTRMQYNDYWPMIVEVLGSDGGLKVDGLLKFRNEHPIALPKLLYWLNARLAAGSNVTLGIAVVGIVLLTLWATATIVRRVPWMNRCSRLAVVVGASFVFFSPRGSWYFVKSMSGSAWLLSHLLVVAAFASHAKGRRFAPIAFGVLASISYGTGLAVWPALVVVGVLRDRSFVRQWTAALTGAVVLSAYWVRYDDIRAPRSPWFPEPTTLDRIEGALSIMGSFVHFEDGRRTVAIGAAIVILGVVAAALTSRRVWTSKPSIDTAGATALIGLFIFTGTAAVLMAGSRAVWSIDTSGGRYSIVGSSLFVSVLGLMAAALPTLPDRIPTGAKRSALAVALVLVVAVGWSGQFAADALKRSRANQDTLQVAMHLDLASNATYWQGGWEAMPGGLEPLLRANGQVPFDSPQEFGCGRIGTMIEGSELAGESPYPAQAARSADSSLVSGGALIEGFVDVGDAEIDCIVVRGDTGRVRGAGGSGTPSTGYGSPSHHKDGRVWFKLMARDAEVLEVWFKLRGETQFHRVPQPST